MMFGDICAIEIDDDVIFAVKRIEEIRESDEYTGFRLTLEQRSIKVLAYNLETILAEKLEPIISRGDQNTRPRDYYDIFILFCYSLLIMARLNKILYKSWEIKHVWRYEYIQKNASNGRLARGYRSTDRGAGYSVIYVILKDTVHQKDIRSTWVEARNSVKFPIR